MFSTLQQYYQKQTEAAPLAVFRILFGLLMLFSLLRFWANGWIDKFYIQPNFFFSYYGFEWVQPLGMYTYLLFILCGLAALMVALGFKYRLAIIFFFLSFTYIELIDKTLYLNHYYFISVLSCLMIFLPANAYFSIDAKLNPKKAFQKIPAWTIDSIKLLVGIVYFYAGIAKLNSDWLLKAQPLKIWLPGRYDFPIIGHLLEQNWMHYFFSWSGAAYDLCIPFLLLFSKTRKLAFFLVVSFHILTRMLFPIGMFPFIMIASSLIFFDAKLHHKLLKACAKLFSIQKTYFDNGRVLLLQSKAQASFLISFFVFQLLFPFRYLLYPGNLFWTEEGYRFSWRVMLMEKAGYAQFKIVDAKTGDKFYVNNSDFLHPIQEKQLSTQADFMLEYAQHLKKHYEKDGYENVGVFVDAHVAFNGRKSKRYIDPNVNLCAEKESFKPKKWILPFNE